MSIERGSLLYQTGRYDMAEQEFRGALIAEPNNALAHAMIGMCLLHGKQYAQATEEARQAITLRPDWHVGYAALSSILFERERLKEAASAIGQAIGLDPFNPGHLAVLAEIRLKQRKWNDALIAADRGLEINPEHSGCLNARGIALVNLGRREEASATIVGALGRDPHNAVTHANQGWALLHSGDHKAALEHFREALRINPEMQWAKSGIVEALKARNIVYRLMLRYFLFMSRLRRQAQWGIIVGGYFGYQVLLRAVENNPGLGAWVWPLLIAYIIFVYLSWLSAPLFNLMLRIDRYGRYALSRDQRVGSNWLGGCFAIAIGFAIALLVTRDMRFLPAAIISAILSIPISSVFRCEEGWPRWTMATYSAGMVLLGSAIIISFFGFLIPRDPGMDDVREHAITLFAWGILLATFVANALGMARVRK